MVPIGPLPWASRIDVRSSRDLVTWSRPRTLLRPSLAWHEEPGRGRAVGNPCLVRTEDGWRLYYSAGLVFLEDCGFCEPRYVGVAEGLTPVGPFRPLADPMLGPDPADRWTNQGAGAIKAVAVADGWVALQNGIYLDPATGHSGSAVLVLDSADGVSWSRSLEAPLLAPGAPEWMRSHVYAVDLGHSGGELVIYFNARNDWHWRRGRESIGRAVAGPFTQAPGSPGPRHASGRVAAASSHGRAWREPQRGACVTTPRPSAPNPSAREAVAPGAPARSARGQTAVEPEDPPGRGVADGHYLREPSLAGRRCPRGGASPGERVAAPAHVVRPAPCGQFRYAGRLVRLGVQLQDQGAVLLVVANQRVQRALRTWRPSRPPGRRPGGSSRVRPSRPASRACSRSAGSPSAR